MDVCGTPRIRKHPIGDVSKRARRVGSNKQQKKITKQKKKRAMIATCDLEMREVEGKKITKKHECLGDPADLCVERCCGQVDRLYWWTQGGWPRDPSDKKPDLPP